MRKILALVGLLGYLTGCGSSQAPANTVYQTGPHTVVITVFNTGTQDSSLGTKYHMAVNVNTTIPDTIVRISGNTLLNGVGVGIDLGGVQCYYNANTQTQNVFTFNQCTNGGVPGDKLKYSLGDMISIWSYNHVMSNDSTVELVLEGETI